VFIVHRCDLCSLYIIVTCDMNNKRDRWAKFGYDTFRIQHSNRENVTSTFDICFTRLIEVLVLWNALELFEKLELIETCVAGKSYLQRPIQAGLPCIQENDMFMCQVTFSRIAYYTFLKSLHMTPWDPQLVLVHIQGLTALTSL
jgi:hypothetical protein